MSEKFKPTPKGEQKRWRWYVSKECFRCKQPFLKDEERLEVHGLHNKAFCVKCYRLWLEEVLQEDLLPPLAEADE